MFSGLSIQSFQIIYWILSKINIKFYHDAEILKTGDFYDIVKEKYLDIDIYTQIETIYTANIPRRSNYYIVKESLKNVIELLSSCSYVDFDEYKHSTVSIIVNH